MMALLITLIPLCIFICICCCIFLYHCVYKAETDRKSIFQPPPNIVPNDFYSFPENHNKFSEGDHHINAKETFVSTCNIQQIIDEDSINNDIELMLMKSSYDRYDINAKWKNAYK